jgi:hypothetical protein
MNIWALDKDNTIKHLLLLLTQEFGADAITLPDADSLHHKAVRIASRNTPATAYLYSYGQADERYGLHLEYPYNAESNISELEDMYEDLSYESLLEILKVHFEWRTHKIG